MFLLGGNIYSFSKIFFFSRSYILPWPPRTATGMDGTLPHCQLKEEQEEQKEDQIKCKWTLSFKA